MRTAMAQMARPLLCGPLTRKHFFRYLAGDKNDSVNFSQTNFLNISRVIIVPVFTHFFVALIL